EEALANRSLIRTFSFFFQAEDGIRDYKVTGVQTCALPISRCCGITLPTSSTFGWPLSSTIAATAISTTRSSTRCCVDCVGSPTEIGRASCRERVQIKVAGIVVSKLLKGKQGIKLMDTQIC